MKPVAFWISAVIGVLMKPRPIALTVILLGASSTASTLLSIHTPALLTAYSPAPGVGNFAAPDAILMMRPPLPALTISRATARSHRNTPSSLMLRTFFQSANGFALSGVGLLAPSSP